MEQILDEEQMEEIEEQTMSQYMKGVDNKEMSEEEK